jgi:chitodextrinase
VAGSFNFGGCLSEDAVAGNSVFVDFDDYDSSPVLSSASPDHKTVPSRSAALRKEKELTDSPMFRSIQETVRTLDNDEVDKIEAGREDNPENVKRVEFVLTEESYHDLFPRRHSSYTYQRFLQAFGKFPGICSYRGTEEKSDVICRKTLATMFAHFTQATGGHNPSDKDYDEWRQGLAVVREQNCQETGVGCEYNSNCDDEDLITKKWACGKDRTGNYRKYFGRGAKQLSYNFNYGQFSQAMFGDGRLLLDFPKFVADTWLNLASATWFYSYPQPPKPSMLHVIDGTWVPNNEDRRNGIEPGFGATINIINGGLECNTKDGRESKQASNRIAYYKKFAWYLYVDFENEQLGCANQKQFTANGAGALPIYWDKDWQHPYQCKLVSYQTAFSSLVAGEYIGCVEENFQVVLFS